ncbi:MAG: phage portal protein [Chloroflexi bacterium]|nr:phage portal protein [Chloroflexota bacterium]
MIVSKGTSVVWTGSPASWGTWARSLNLGTRWVSYAELYRRQTWVRTVVDKRADLLARLPLKVYEHDQLNRPERPDHPYARLLAHPNPVHSRFWLWRWVQATYDTYGEAFLAKQRDSGGRPTMLIPLHPMSMHANEERDGRVVWDFDNGRVRMTGIPSEDLFHPKTHNPDSFVRGLSKLESLRATLENEDAALRAQSAFWRNGARPGVALKHPANLSKPAQERLKLQWQQIAAGADKTGTTVILEEGMEAQVLQLSAEEAQYIDARKLNREEVVAAYDMPPPAVHILDHATYSNITAQLRSVYRDTMAPLCVMYEAELETQLRGSVRPGADGPDFGDEVYAEWLLDGVLRGDFEERAEAYQKAINSGWTTPAEVRKLENLPFLEGSDQLFINSTMVPIEVAEEAGEEDADGFDPQLINAVGVLIRSGFDPTSVLAALGLPPMEHLGLLPITLQSEEVFDAAADAAEAGILDETAVRMLMGRLSRQKILSEVDAKALTCGLNGQSEAVTAQLEAAVAGDEGVMGLRERIRHLGRRSPAADQTDPLAKAIAALAGAVAAKEAVNQVYLTAPPAPPPAEVHFAEGAILVRSDAPEITVNVPKAGGAKRVERDADGNVVRLVEEE